MLPEIEVFIKDAYSPEVVTTIYNGFEVLDEFLVEDFQGPYLSILMEEDNEDSGPVADRFIALLDTNITELLVAHEVKPNDDAQLDNLIKISRAILTVQDYEDKENIYAIIEAGVDPDEIFAEVIEFVSDMSSALVMTCVDNVSAAFIDKLRQLVTEVDLVTEVEQMADNSTVINLKKLRDYLQFPEALGFALINKGLPIGAQFKQYFEYARKHTDLLPPEQVAKELIVLFYMSADAQNNPILFYRNNSQFIIDDLQKLTKVDVLINKHVSEFSKYLLSADSKDPGVSNAQA